MTVQVSGTCEDRYAPVREAFVRNFQQLEEHGAAVAVWQNGRLVVDLWGGWKDRAATMPWQADTLVCMMSVVKAVTALLVHVLADRRAIDLDAPVSDYWPEFAQGGKDRVLVRHVLDHRAGVPGISRRLEPEAVYDWHAMTAAIAAEPARWAAGQVPGYHPVTMGFIAGELIRRVAGVTAGEFLGELMQQPDPFDYYIGVPEDSLIRCAEVFGNFADTIFGATDPGTLAYQSIAPLRYQDFNGSEFRRAEIPSINGHGTPRSIAILFGHLAECRAGRRSDPISVEAIARATTEQWWGIEQTSGHERRMGYGFVLAGPKGVPMSANPRAFGHGGAGGSFAFADPDLGLGFAYGTSHLHSGKGTGPRTQALAAAVVAAATGQA
ncbi:MAG: serine hydrolase domain-containing protein [Lautropia sp.]